VQLVGKPDYLIEQKDGMIVPVELKSGRAPEEPHDGHVLQLAAYCLLVEENYGIRPDFGIIQYKDRAFAVDYTEELEDDLLDLLEEMREGLLEEDLERDHNDWRKCAKCGVRGHCYQRLA
jgi:CRISPR-associated exonuclease Cas4